MTRLLPVMYDEASEQRKTTAAWYSSVCAMRPSGINELRRDDEIVRLPIIDAARRYGVDAHAAIGPIGCQVASQADQSAF